MMPRVHIAAIVFAFLAGLIHFYIFSLESFMFDNPKVWKLFGVEGPEAAKAVKPWAYNQGYYNLFLAVTAVIGSGLLAVAKAGSDQLIWAQALIYAGCGSMFLASLVLLNSGGKPRAALIQGLCPLLAVAYTWASS